MMKYNSPLFQLRVLCSGKPVQEYHKDNHTFVEGRAGSEFELQLTNLTNRRLLVHPSVDGLSVMNGELAKKDDSEHGYVLMPWATSAIPGWRLDDQRVAAFQFVGDGASYAEKKGSGENKGVIACAVWEEKVYLPEIKFYSTPDCISSKGILRSHGVCGQSVGGTEVNCCVPPCGPAACAEEQTIGVMNSAVMDFAPEAATTQNLGTGFGQAQGHAVRHIDFEPATSEPVCVAVIYYDDLKGLMARGIKISEGKTSSGLPNPFPASKEEGCKPPADWAPTFDIAEGVAQAVQNLRKHRVPVDHILLPDRIELKVALEKCSGKKGYFLGYPIAFHDSDDIVAVAPDVYGGRRAFVRWAAAKDANG